MKRIYVTMGARVEREEDSPEDKGEFLVIDWETKSRVGAYACDSGKEVLIGRSRGASGMAWHEDKIYITCRYGLMSLDPDTYEEVSHDIEGKYGGFHGIASDGETLWVTCHGIDRVIGIRNDRLVEELITCTEPDDSTPSGFEERVNGLNAVGFSPQGEMFLMYAHRHLVYNWTTQEVVAEGLTDSPHDICFISDTEFLSCKSSLRELVLVDTIIGTHRIVFTGEQHNRKVREAEYAVPGWLRGIAYNKKTNTVFVAAAPGILRELDATTWELRGEYVFDTRPKANTFEIMLDPRDW